MKYNLKEMAVFLIIGFFAYIISGAVNPYIPSFGNPILTQAIVFAFPLLILYLVWVNYGKKVAD